MRTSLLMAPLLTAAQPHACLRLNRHKVWSAVDVIRAAGYPVEVHSTCMTEDQYMMEIVRIMRPGEWHHHNMHSDHAIIMTLSRSSAARA